MWENLNRKYFTRNSQLWSVRDALDAAEWLWTDQLIFKVKDILTSPSPPILKKANHEDARYGKMDEKGVFREGMLNINNAAASIYFLVVDIFRDIRCR